jgi:plasmid maintenance system antidote protein VapI
MPLGNTSSQNFRDDRLLLLSDGLRVLVACEFSGVVRDAFWRLGHDATSCDLLPAETPGQHIVGDVRDLDLSCYDMMIAHPPCTHLAKSGARWWEGREKEQDEALEFVRWLLNAPVPRIAIENPPGRIGTQIRKADQHIHPWWFGHGEMKATGLWLKNLPPLVPTWVVDGREERVYLESPGEDRWKRRSRTLPGVAGAMAAQWGGLAKTPGEEVSRNRERPAYPRSVSSGQTDRLSPGETLAELLEIRGWTKALLSQEIGYTPKHINCVVKGKAPISVGFALALEEARFGSAESWLRRDADYQLAQARAGSPALALGP